jgi:hypothetical protein
MKLLELINRSNLDMSKAARMKRAEAMGFDTSQVWYHANTGGIEGEGFDDARLPASDPDRPFNAHWFSHEPSEHASYPSTGNTITPVFLSLDKSKEAPHGVWRKLTRKVHDAWDGGDNERNAADMIREKLVSMGYTHAVRGREPIDAAELKNTGETSFMTSTGTKVTLKWEKLNLPPGAPEYTEEEMEVIRAHTQVKRDYDMYHSLVVDAVVNKKMTPEMSEKLKAKGIELKDELDRLEPLTDAANERAYDVLNANREQVDTLQMYDSDIGYVTGYHDLDDFIDSSPEKEDIAVLDPSIIRSVYAAFDPEEEGNNKIMSSLGESDDRLARAKADGFDTSTVWYHGSPEGDIHAFQGYRGDNIAGSFTRDPDFAAQWAAAGVENIETNLSPEEFALDPAAQVIYPVFLRLKNVFDLRNAQHRELVGMSHNRQNGDYADTEDHAKDIQAAGFDGYVDYEINDETEGNVAVFDPKNIRSVHAVYGDPNSSNIMASLGESERPAPIVAYHATFPDNRDNIRMHGLDPKYSDTFEEGAVFFATGGTPDPRMDIWKANLSGLDIEYDPTQEGGDSEHWWYTHQLVVPDRLTLVQKGTG